MDKNIKIGVIGVGMVADKHINNFKKDGRAEVKWLCDKSELMLTKKQELHGITNGTTDYREILQDPEVTAVVISTPPTTHPQIMLDAMQAGKNILSEKPICINREDLDNLLDESIKHEELVMLDCSCRHSRLQPKYKFVKQVIESGRLGDIYYIHHNGVARQNRGGIEYHPEAKWFLNKKISGGGPIMDWGVYDLSFHLGILGDVPELVRLEAFTVNGLDRVEHGAPVFDVEEHGVSMMTFDTGLKYYYERSSNAHNETPNETRIYGTKGGMKFSFTTWDSNEIEIFYVDKDGKGKARSEKIAVDMSGHESDELELARHFVDCLEGKAKPAMPLSLAAKHIRMLYEILKG